MVVGEGSGRGKKAEGRFMGQAEPLKYEVWTGASILPHLTQLSKSCFLQLPCGGTSITGVRIMRSCFQ